MKKYLRTIYELEKKHTTARTSELAKSLDVTPGTITNTVKQLKKRRLITHKPYRGVKLTEEGQQVAVEAARRYRLTTQFLTDILHVEESKAQKAADKLQQCISTDILEKIEVLLKNRSKQNSR